MRWRNVIIVAVLSVPLILILALGFGRDPRAVPSVLPGKNAPAFTLTSLDGEHVSLAQLRGRPIVLNFWSTWCVPCESEHGLLQRAARQWGDRVQFVGVVYQDGDEAARRYLQSNGSAYPQLMDPGSHCAIDYGVAGVPETFFIDAKGVVQHKEAGPLTPGMLQQLLTRLVQGGTP